MKTYKYRIDFTEDFNRSYKKLTKNNINLVKRIEKTFDLLANNPFYSGLKTHRVISRKFGEKYSSRVTGDLRIIWEFVDNKLVISILDLGGHDGGGVYK